MKRMMILVALAMLAVGGGRVFGQAKLPTIEEIRDLFATAKFQPCIMAVSRVVDSPDGGKGYNKFELYWLKGESHLRLNGIKLAGDAFANAAKEAKLNSPQADLARATEVLVRKSKADHTYVPRHPKDPKAVNPIPMLDPNGRAPAFVALFNDELIESQNKIKAAGTSKTLPPLQEAMDMVVKLNAVELAATGKQEDSARLFSAIGGQVFRLMGEDMKRMEEQVTVISTNASRPVETNTSSARVQTVTGALVGLSANDINILKDCITSCEKIREAAKDAGDLALKLNNKEWAFSTISQKASNVSKRAEVTLNKDYAGHPVNNSMRRNNKNNQNLP